MKLNGNILLQQAKNQPSGGVMMKNQTELIVEHAIQILTPVNQQKYQVLRQMHLAFTILLVMSASGFTIVGIRIIKARQLMDQFGKAVIAVFILLEEVLLHRRNNQLEIQIEKNLIRMKS